MPPARSSLHLLSLVDLLNHIGRSADPPGAADWDAVIRRVRSHPRQVAKSSQHGDNCLSIAINLKAPSKVILAMLEVCPSSAKAVHAETGLTALHLAVSNGRPPEVVRQIVKAWPGASTRSTRLSGGSTPLHSVRNVETAKILVEACPSSLRSTNNAGYLPIHRAAYAERVPADVLQYLIDEGRKRRVGGRDDCGQGCGGVFVETEHGITPIQAVIDVIDHGTHLSEFQSTDKEASLSPAAARKWEKLTIVAKAANFSWEKAMSGTKRAPKDKTLPLLHSIVAMNSPESIVGFALKLHPEQCSDLGPWGISVLHLAASSPAATEGIFRMLVDRPYGCGKNAKTLDPNGNLPLHNYISFGNCRYDEAMKVLIDAEPRALEARDGLNGFYPFMLAAEGEDSDLDTVYKLLRETPCLVSQCVELGRSQKKIKGYSFQAPSFDQLVVWMIPIVLAMLWGPVLWSLRGD